MVFGAHEFLPTKGPFGICELGLYSGAAMWLAGRQQNRAAPVSLFDSMRQLLESKRSRDR